MLVSVFMEGQSFKILYAGERQEICVQSNISYVKAFPRNIQKGQQLPSLNKVENRSLFM